MPHDRPIPDAARSPFPVHPQPRPDDSAPPPPASADKPTEDRTRKVIAGAAVGIGSAAIVAALLYANRKPAKPTPPKHDRPVEHTATGKARSDRSKKGAKSR